MRMRKNPFFVEREFLILSFDEKGFFHLSKFRKKVLLKTKYILRLNTFVMIELKFIGFFFY